MKLYLLILALAIVFGCEKKETGHITATIVQNDIFKGYAISDREQIPIENGLKLLFKDSPFQGAIGDSILNIINTNKFFEAKTNSVSLQFHGGIVRDTIYLTIAREPGPLKKRGFMIEARENTSYKTISNTTDGCVIKAIPMMPVGKEVNVGIANDRHYTLDTIDNHFYDDKHVKLDGFRGLKSWSFAGKYKLSVRVNAASKPPLVKSIIYDTTKQEGSDYIPYSLRSVI